MASPKEMSSRITPKEASWLRERFDIEASDNDVLEEIGKQFDFNRKRVRETAAKARKVGGRDK